jgi:nicotinic acid phosphoribosyltransferase
MHIAFDLTGPIVHSRLEPDFYKFTMGQLIWRKYAGVETEFTFSNRTTKARLGRVLDVGELRVDETLRDELNRGSSRAQFIGTSNTYEAMVTGVEPTGTSAHELPMVLAGVLDDGSDDPRWLRRAQRQVIEDWWEQYGSGLAIFLPDTWGTDFFFGVIEKEDLRRWKGFRWDSGDLVEFGERVIRAYEEAGINPEEKMLIASDALDLEAILGAEKHFGGRIRMSYGWGTGLTNDLLDSVMMNDRWFGPMSLVLKPTRANGRRLVKLADNPAKAIGPPLEVDRYRRIAAYRDHPAVMPKY